MADLVVAQPSAAALFERLGLDYCCGGGQRLDEACARRGLDTRTVAILLDALQHETPATAPDEAHDVARASITELCDHIVVRHHGPLRPGLDRIAHLLATVVRVHGRDHPELVDLARVFNGMGDELRSHMRAEEDHLFPTCRALDAGEEPPFDVTMLALLEEGHASTGDALCSMRELTGGFDSRRALCSTHRTLLNVLRSFELDLHQHVHEENNLLFPRVRARADLEP